MKLALLAACAVASTMVAGVAFAQAPAPSPGNGTLEAVRSRGQLICGVYGSVAGFSLLDSQGRMNGLDADMCRAVATAIFGDASKVKFVAVSGITRFTALQSGEIDLLSRETTWTTQRESSLGLLFAGTNFYDGTGFMVKASAGIKAATDLAGATICVAPGTSTELAVQDYFGQRKLQFTPVLIDDLNTIQQAFISGRCDAYSTDRSGLAAFRYAQATPADYVLLPEIISKEPDGPAVRKGDDRWFDLVRWTLFAQMTAEELGVTSQNIDAMAAGTNPDIRRLLGADGDIGKSLGVDNKWAFNIVKQVGNYGEMYDRNIGPLAIPRGLNSPWTKGGLQYAPPMR